MANRAYLVGHAIPDTAGPSDNGFNYDPDSEILAGSSYIIPALWLSVFDEEDLTVHEVEGYRIPTLVTPASIACERLSSRMELLQKTFTSNVQQILDWKSLVEDSPYDYLKVDTYEIWELEPDSFEALLPSAVRWFKSCEPEDFQELLAISGLQYDSDAGQISKQKIAKYNLHGYEWVRDVPWSDDEKNDGNRNYATGLESRTPEEAQYQRVKEQFLSQLQVSGAELQSDEVRGTFERNQSEDASSDIPKWLIPLCVIVGLAIGVLRASGCQPTKKVEKAPSVHNNRDFKADLKKSEGGEAFKKLYGVPSKGNDSNRDLK